MRFPCESVAFAFLSPILAEFVNPCASAQQPAAATNAPAQQPAAAAVDPSIRQSLGGFIEAYNKGDSKALAAYFTEDAEIAPLGAPAVSGRDKIEAYFAGLFQEVPDRSLVVETESARTISPDVAVLECAATVTKPGVEVVGSRFTVIVVRREGKWLQSSVREQPAAEPTSRERLEELAWMVGDWVEEDRIGGFLVKTSCKWSDNENFLLRSYEILSEGKSFATGTQRIGWDPLQKKIRSWVFDSEGGFSQEFWTRSGDQWLVKSEGVLPEGETASATHVVSLVNKDRVGWRTIDRTAGSEILPDVDEFFLVRTPPPAAK
jgi:uncharacterized protein (TIGR02246 family)